jgi:hypothetical protein
MKTRISTIIIISAAITISLVLVWPLGAGPTNTVARVNAVPLITDTNGVIVAPAAFITVNGLATTTALNNATGSLATASITNGLATTTSVNTAIAPLATTTSVNAAVAPLASTSYVNEAIAAIGTDYFSGIISNATSYLTYTNGFLVSTNWP